MAVDREKLNALLKWYAKLVADLESVVVVDREGLPMASHSRGSEGVDEEVIGGLSAVVEPILKRINTEFQAGAFGAGAFDTEKNRLVFVEAGKSAILVSICDAMANIDEVYPYAYLVAEKVSRILDGRQVSPVLPSLPPAGAGRSMEKNKLVKLAPAEGDYAHKFVLGGEGGVGKTTLVTTFIQGKFERDYKATIGANIMKQECAIKGSDAKVRLTIWDLAGQSQFARVRSLYFKNAAAGLLVYDVTRRETFDKVRQWYEEAKKHGRPDMAFMLVANKIDLADERVVSREEGQALAEELGIPYFETSALDGDLVQEAFEMLAFIVVKRHLEVQAL